MGRADFIPPTVSYHEGPPGADFILGVVPPLTPETFEPELATEETERKEAEASRQSGLQEIKQLNDLFNSASTEGEI